MEGQDMTMFAVCLSVLSLGMCALVFYLALVLVRTNTAFERFASRVLDMAMSNSQDARDIMRARFEADANVKLPTPPKPWTTIDRPAPLDDSIPVNPITGEPAPFTL